MFFPKSSFLPVLMHSSSLYLFSPMLQISSLLNGFKDYLFCPLHLQKFCPLYPGAWWLHEKMPYISLYYSSFSFLDYRDFLHLNHLGNKPGNYLLTLIMFLILVPTSANFCIFSPFVHVFSFNSTVNGLVQTPIFSSQPLSYSPTSFLCLLTCFSPFIFSMTEWFF